LNWNQLLCCSVFLAVLVNSQSCLTQTLEPKPDTTADVPTDGDVQQMKEFYGGRILTGSVQLSEELPKVPECLIPGREFPDDRLTKLKKQDQWDRIPTWLAGHWISSSVTLTDGSTLNREKRFYSGTERDAEGAVWNRLAMPYLVIDYNKRNSIYRLADFADTPVNTADVYQSRRHYFTARVDENHKIVDTWQEECLSTITPNKDGTLDCINTTRTFDVNGKFCRDYVDRGCYRLEKRFEPTSDDHIRKSLRRYLKASGLTKLIP
jgi:hypothetical protein